MLGVKIHHHHEKKHILNFLHGYFFGCRTIFGCVLNNTLVYTKIVISPSDSYIWDVELVRILQNLVLKGTPVRITIDESDCIQGTPVHDHLASTLPEWRTKWPTVRILRKGKHFFLAKRAWLSASYNWPHHRHPGNSSFQSANSSIEGSTLAQPADPLRLVCLQL